jgi:amino acid transporter
VQLKLIKAAANIRNCRHSAAGANSLAFAPAQGAALAEAERLKRDIGPISSAMLVLNGVVGAGIFALPGTLHADFGAFSPWLIPLFGLVIFIVAIPMAETASLFDRTGGPVAYTKEAFGSFISFQTGWAYYVTRLTAFAANTLVFTTYAATLWAPLGEGIPRAALIIILVTTITAINVIGVKRAVTALDAFSFLKVAPLLIVVLLGIVLYAFRGGEAIVVPEFSEVEKASLLVLYAFIGFEVVLFPAGETKNAAQTIPRALITTLLAIIGLYFLIQFAYSAVMAGEEAAKAPLVAFGEKVIGPAGALLMLLAALFSIGGNLLGNLVVAPRATYALARDGSLPAWFGHVSERYATPANSIVFLGATAMLLALSGSFAGLAIVSTLARLFVYAASIASLPVIRKKRGLPPRTGSYRFFAPVVIVLSLVFCVWAIVQSTLDAWKVFGALIAVGAVLYGAARWTRP